MNRSTKILGIAIVAVIALVACAETTPVGAPDGSPTPARTTFTEDEWTIATPSGWTRRVITPDADAKKAVRYEGPNGEYFIVAIDPVGSGYEYDALWHYEVKGNAFEVAAKEQANENGDGRFSGYILWKTGTAPVKVGGHVWYFQFGNSSTTTIDAATFEEIAESVRVAD